MKGKLRKPIALLMVLIMIFSMSISVLADDEAGNSSTDEEIIEVVEGEPEGEDVIDEGQDDVEGEDPGEETGEGAPEGIEEGEEEEDADLEEEGFEEEEDALGDNPDHITAKESNIEALGFYYPLKSRFKRMDVGDSGKPEWPEPGAINLTKQAEPVEGFSDQWEVTLTIEGKNIQKTSDVVLVIDKSGSMKDTKMDNTISAAKKFVDELLLVDSATRIAVVTFDKNAHLVSDFVDYEKKDELKGKINSINADGGTNIQAGIHQAQALLNASEADNKVIVLLGDGEATYSYKVEGASGIELTGHDKKGNPIIVYSSPQIEEIDYTKIVGSGSSYSISTGSQRYQIPCSIHAPHATTFPKNNGIPTIWEADLAKSEGIIIYSIALQAGTNGEEVLKGCATDEDHYYVLNSPNLGVLTGVFDDISGQIAYAANDAVVIDPMGVMFDLISAEIEIIVSQGTAEITETNKIKWTVGNVTEGTPATMTYIVRIKSEAEKDQKYPTNDETIIEYIDINGDKAIDEFEVPKVSIGGGSVLFKGYLVDEEGRPISGTGTVVDRPDQAKRLYDKTYSDEPLDYNVSYNITRDTIADYKYVKYVWGETSGFEDTVAVLLQASAPTQTVWFAYRKVEDGYNVYYDANGGEGELVDYNNPYVAQEAVTVLENTFTKAGYHFIGWLLDIEKVVPTDYNPLVDGDDKTLLQKGDTFYMPLGDVTLYAQWEINKYTVIFKDYDGTILKTEKVEHGKDATAPPSPSRSDYNFNSWDKSYKNVTSDLVVTALYTKKSTGGGGSSSGGTSKPKDKDPVVVVVPVEEIPADLPQLNKADHIQYIQGYPDGTVKPEGHITRDEVAAVFFRLLDPAYREKIRTESHNFSDVASTRWSNKHIATLAKGGIITGYLDGTFKPGNYITRSELATIASRFDNLSTTTDDKFSDIAGHWANKYINSAAEKGWVKGYVDGTFKPDQNITRAEFVTLVNNVLERRVTRSEILPESKKFPDLPEDKWYYEAMMEAVNSHRYERLDNGYEHWTEIYKPIIEM